MALSSLSDLKHANQIKVMPLCRIDRRADNIGPRPLVRNLAVAEKSFTGTDFSQPLDSHQNRDQPNPKLPRTTYQVTRKKITRTKWTREEYKEFSFAFNCAQRAFRKKYYRSTHLLTSGKHILEINENILTAIS